MAVEAMADRAAMAEPVVVEAMAAMAALRAMAGRAAMAAPVAMQAMAGPAVKEAMAELRDLAVKTAQVAREPFPTTRPVAGAKWLRAMEYLRA